MSEITEITIVQAEQIIADEEVLLLDCRDQRDYINGHHPMAINLSDHNAEALIMRTPKQKKVIVYCYLGHASKEKAKMFADFGFKHCYSVQGGYTAWKKSLEEQKPGTGKQSHIEENQYIA